MGKTRDDLAFPYLLCLVSYAALKRASSKGNCIIYTSYNIRKLWKCADPEDIPPPPPPLPPPPSDTREPTPQPDPATSENMSPLQSSLSRPAQHTEQSLNGQAQWLGDYPRRQMPSHSEFQGSEQIQQMAEEGLRHQPTVDFSAQYHSGNSPYSQTWNPATPSSHSTSLQWSDQPQQASQGAFMHSESHGDPEQFPFSQPGYKQPQNTPSYIHPVAISCASVPEKPHCQIPVSHYTPAGSLNSYPQTDWHQSSWSAAQEPNYAAIAASYWPSMGGNNAWNAGGGPASSSCMATTNQQSVTAVDRWAGEQWLEINATGSKAEFSQPSLEMSQGWRDRFSQGVHVPAAQGQANLELQNHQMIQHHSLPHHDRVRFCPIAYGSS